MCDESREEESEEDNDDDREDDSVEEIDDDNAVASGVESALDRGAEAPACGDPDSATGAVGVSADATGDAAEDNADEDELLEEVRRVRRR